MIFKNMNNKKSMKRISRISKKRKYNKKIKNTRKNYKRDGGGGKKQTLKTIAKALVTATETIVAKNIESSTAIKAPETTANYLAAKIQTNKIKDVLRDIVYGVLDNIMKQKNTTEKDKASLKEYVEKELKKIAEKEEKEKKVKFSELASGGIEWLAPVNTLTRKINKKKRDANYLLQLKDIKIDDTIASLNIENYEEIFTYLSSLNEDTKKEYDIKDINFSTTSITYIRFTQIQKKIVSNVPLLKRESTFTYNLLKNIDISPEEIFKAYCVKWTKDICKDGDTPMILLGRMIYHFVFDAPHSPPNNASNTIKPSVINSVRTSKSVKPSKYTRYTYIPGYNISINAAASIKTIYGALSGFDNEWLDNILGILDSIIDTIFDDIKNSDDNGLDFITMLVSAMTGKTEYEIEDYYKTHPNINALKNQLNVFLKKNAKNFSEEYKTNHFIGFSEEFQEKIKTTVIEEIKTKVAQQISTIAIGLKTFEKELLNFIINVDDLGTMEFENSLGAKNDVDELYDAARRNLKILDEV